jgi:hypothetical protein
MPLSLLVLVIPTRTRLAPHHWKKVLYISVSFYFLGWWERKEKSHHPTRKPGKRKVEKREREDVRLG